MHWNSLASQLPRVLPERTSDGFVVWIAMFVAIRPVSSSVELPETDIVNSITAALDKPWTTGCGSTEPRKQGTTCHCFSLS